MESELTRYVVTEGAGAKYRRRILDIAIDPRLSPAQRRALVIKFSGYSRFASVIYVGPVKRGEGDGKPS